jgi:hypothetical protein
MNQKEKLERLLDDIETADPDESVSMAEEIYQLYKSLRAERLSKGRKETREEQENQDS